LIAPVARLVGVPLVMDVDSQIPDQLRYSGFATRGPLLALAEALESHALRRASVVITVCQSLTDGVTRVAPRERVFQIEDPPLVEGPLADAAAVTALRASLRLSDSPVILYSGNFEPYQGVELLIDAATRVPEGQFVFMGGEPAEIEALRARARGHCVFAGKRPPAELPAFVALADVLVSPRIRGTNTPFKIYTYLASGKPLVATRLPTHTQLLDDSLALLVEPDAAALAAGIRAALADPASASTRARRGVELIEREYSGKRFEEKVRDAYATLRARKSQ
jgi:glycosyltransferase involved in cell wall biosynthesis